MQSYLPRRRRPSPGPSASARLFLVGIVGVFIACTSDDPPPGTAGQGGDQNVPNGEVRDLPGDGLQPTPDFDTDDRQAVRVPPSRIIARVDDLRDDLSSTPGPDRGPLDAAPPVEDGLDAGGGDSASDADGQE